MIRVIRHSARTGFTIDGTTYQALLRHREELKKCSPSRVRDEFLRDLKEGMACPSLDLMLQTGLLFSIFPDFIRALGDRNPSKEKARRLLLALFNLVDQLVKAGKSVPDSILLALLVSPFLQAVTIEHPFVGEKERRIYRTELIRSVLHQIFVPYSFPKGAKEAAAQILIAQANLRKSLHYGAIPKRMRTKRYFQEAVLFFGMEAQARGETVPHPIRRSVPPDFLPWWPKEFKKRGHR
jgi:poly(A) polymerase